MQSARKDFKDYKDYGGHRSSREDEYSYCYTYNENSFEHNTSVILFFDDVRASFYMIYL